MATYGRQRMVERALACFLLQDYPERELIILNTHAVPLRFKQLSIMVQVYNEPCWSTLGDQRNRLLDLATGDFIRTWDDDDIYLPHAISQGVRGILSQPPSPGRDIPGAAAWKPKQSWYSPDNGKTLSLVENILEPSITFRADVARKYGYFRNSSGDEHLKLLDGIANQEGGVVSGDVGADTSFVYIWGNGTPPHISGTLDQKVPAAERAARWRQQQTDVSREPLLPDWKGAEEWHARVEAKKLKTAINPNRIP